MSVKQDRTNARTVQDIERKYSFGKSFAETINIARDLRNEVDTVVSGLKDDVANLSTTLKRNTEEIVMQAEKVAELSSEVELKLDANAVTVIVEEEIEKGIETKTGYKFNSDGLNISKSGTEIENSIDETGMYVKKSGDNVLVANKDGVEATDLHAKTYLIIGSGDGRSRFEDYGIDRTGCFWVGG